jgi:hypothetical protein
MVEIHGNELVLIRGISLTLTQNCPGKPDHFIKTPDNYEVLNQKFYFSVVAA